MKDSLLINPLLNNDLSQNKTISISKINSPKKLSQKIDSKSQTSSNFLYNKKISRNNNYNNENNINHLNYIKKFFTNDININKNKKKNLFVNSIQLDKNYLRLISTRYIQNNNNLSIEDNDKNSSEEALNSKYINYKKDRTDIVKYRFLQSQRNYYKRISNLKENSFIPKDIINFKMILKEYKNSNYLKKMNYLLLKSNNINSKRNKRKTENSSFPSIQNSFHKINNGKIQKNKSFIYFKFKNKDIKNATLKNQKLFKNINNKVNNFSQRLKNYFDNKLQKEQENYVKKINSINKFNNSYESEKIINDNYNKYLNDISSTESNKSRSKENKISFANKNILNKIISKKMKHKSIHIRNVIFNLDKNKLNYSIIKNKDNTNNEKQKKIFKSDNIKSILKLKKISINNKSNPEINKNDIFNQIIREKHF